MLQESAHWEFRSRGGSKGGGQGDLQKPATPETPKAGNIARERANRWRSGTPVRLSAAGRQPQLQLPRPEVLRQYICSTPTTTAWAQARHSTPVPVPKPG